MTRPRQCRTQLHLVTEALLDPTPARFDRVDEHTQELREGARRSLIRKALRRLLKTVRDPEPLRQNALALKQALACGNHSTFSEAWIDGSSIPGKTPRAGLGGVITRSDGQQVATISLPVKGLRAYEAELMAAMATLQRALELGIRNLILYTDAPTVKGAVLRALEGFGDLAALAQRFQQLIVKVIPRRRNCQADLLAKRAARALAYVN